MSDSPVDYYAVAQTHEPQYRLRMRASGIRQWMDARRGGRTLTLASVLFGLLAGYVILDYSRYYDWPSFNDAAQVREYLPASYPVADAHYYQLRNMVETWELYRFNTSADAVAKLTKRLRLSSQGTVKNFAMIVTQPRPHWWHPEQLASAELFAALERGPDGRNYELLYAADTGTVYMIRFEG